MVGLDVFVESPLTAEELGASLTELAHGTRLELKMISSRGTKVYPATGAITDTLDHWRCRFIIREDPGDLWDEDVHQLLARISRRHTWMHIEKLHGVRRRARLHPGPGRELMAERTAGAGASW